MPDEATIGERINMAFMGTSAVAGKGRGVVAATGMESELGRIAGFLQSEEREPTPLQKRLEELGRVLIVACLALVALIFVLQLLRGEKLAHTFLMAVSLAVAAVPEGLPAVVTIALALGLQRMVKRNALIRRLASVETLGSVTVICSDKTGTLTRNEMTVTEIVDRRAALSSHWQRLRAGRRIHVARVPGAPSRKLNRNSRSRSRSGSGATTLNSSRLTKATDAGASSAIRRKARSWWRRARLACGGIPITRIVARNSLRLATQVDVGRGAGRGAENPRSTPRARPRFSFERCAFEQRPNEIVPLSPARREEILQQSRAMADRALARARARLA